ncbi:hypothetical protein AB4Z09_17700 [Rhodococcus sp. TAF43]|nr:MULTISPECIES: hypothetical protein [unclassified Rhodococcus (in: high G+C Gram-positive bacteria)]QKT12317.1 hypothetical protein HUN07_17830 [Rhodococcus sp. W8901]
MDADVMEALVEPDELSSFDEHPVTASSAANPTAVTARIVPGLRKI